MKFTILRKTFLIGAMLLSAFTALSAQTKRPNFDREQTFDVQHYLIRASFDRQKKRIFGDTTVSLKPLGGDLSVVELDAVDMVFESIKLEPAGIDLKYVSKGGKVSVTLDRGYGSQDLIAIRFKYTAQPKKGVYFVPAETRSQEIRHSSQIWTQGEPDEARHWFPSFDFPSDKATTEKYLTVEKDETVIGNGELVDKVENSNGTVTWHYRMPIPHSTYLVSFVIGKYVKIEGKYKNIPLGYYTYPGKEENARTAFSETARMIETFEGLTGVPFPYNKYDQTIVAKFSFGGMENITATTMADTEIFFADFDFGKNIVNDLVSHELAHSWFGNLVTCKNWAELWLNEGFATYMEAVFREQAFGREDYLRKIRSDAAEFLVDDAVNRRRHALYNLRAGDVNSLFDNSSTTYDKGGVVIHMIREQIGTEKFWKGINIYLDRHKFASVESTDLKRSFEEASAQDLGWFFDQWVYGAGAPKLDFKPSYNARTKTLNVTIFQTQTVDTITPTAFRLPLDMVIKTAAGDVRHDIELKKRVQTFSIKLPGKPTSLVIDENEKIPLKEVKIRPITTLK